MRAAWIIGWVVFWIMAVFLVVMVPCAGCVIVPAFVVWLVYLARRGPRVGGTA